MIENLLKLRGVAAQKIDVREFGNFFLTYVRPASPDQQIRWREQQVDSGPEQIALQRVLEEFQEFLREMALDFMRDAGVSDLEANVETDAGGQVLLDLNRARFVPLRTGGVAGIERFFKPFDACLIALEPDPVNLDGPLHRIYAVILRLADQPVSDQCGDPAQARLLATHAMTPLDEHVTQMIELDPEPPRAGSRRGGRGAGNSRGRESRRSMRPSQRVAFVDLVSEFFRGREVRDVDLLRIDLDTAIGKHVKHLRLLDQSPHHPLVMVHLRPRLAGLQPDGLLVQAEGEDRSALGRIVPDSGFD